MNKKLFLILWISVCIAGCSVTGTPQTIVVTATTAPAAANPQSATTAPTTNSVGAATNTVAATTAPTATTAPAATTAPTMPPAQPTNTLASGAVPVTGVTTQVSANTLLDYKVVDSTGAPVGDVKDFVITQPGANGIGQIPYIVVDSSTREDWEIPVPWRNITVRPDTQTVMLPATAAQLANAPGFNKDAWPSSFTAAAAGLQSFWANPGQAAAVQLQGGMNQAADYIRGKDLLDLKITDPQGAQLGKIKDLAIDWTNSQPGSADAAKFSYVVLAVDDTINAAEPMVPIPFRLVHITPGQESAAINLTAAALQSVPNFGSGTLPDLYSGTWATQLQQYWTGK